MAHGRVLNVPKNFKNALEMIRNIFFFSFPCPGGTGVVCETARSEEERKRTCGEKTETESSK